MPSTHTASPPASRKKPPVSPYVVRGILLLAALAIGHTIYYWLHPFLLSYDLWLIFLSWNVEFAYPFLDLLIKSDFASGGIAAFPLAYAFAGLAQLALLLLVPWLMFRRFFGLPTLLYLLLFFISWKVSFFTFGMSVHGQYLFPIVLSLLPYPFLRMTLTDWLDPPPSGERRIRWHAPLAALLLIGFGLWFTPRFFLTAPAIAAWVLGVLWSRNVIRISWRSAAFIGLLLVGAFFILMANRGWGMADLLDRLAGKGTLSIPSGVLIQFKWIFFGMGPFLLLGLFLALRIPWEERPRRAAWLFYGFVAVLLGLMAINLAVKSFIPLVLEFLLYLPLFFMLAWLVLPDRNAWIGRRGYVFLNFLVLYAANVFLGMGAQVRDSLFGPYVLVLLCLVVEKETPRLREKWAQIRSRPTSAPALMMGLLMALFAGNALLEFAQGQRAFYYQAQINDANRTGWERVNRLLAETPGLRIAREPATTSVWALRDGVYRLLNETYETGEGPSRIPDGPHDYFSYFTYYDGPFQHPYQIHENHLFLHAADVAASLETMSRLETAWPLRIVGGAAEPRPIPGGSYLLALAHETGVDPGVAITVDGQSSPVDVREGKRFWFVEFDAPTQGARPGLLEVTAVAPAPLSGFLARRANHFPFPETELARIYPDYSLAFTPNLAIRSPEEVRALWLYEAAP